MCTKGIAGRKDVIFVKWMAPDYYRDFRCIAGDCRHSCCIGWEIDIDPDSLNAYRQVPGAFGERLRSGIVQTEDEACFRLDENERCPFLNGDGLCDIILEMGEAGLCQICADHPRFRNALSDRTEMGVGLCCEAAARLILHQKSPMQLQVIEDDGEDEAIWEEDVEILEMRNGLMNMLQNRQRSVEMRIEEMLFACGVKWPSLTWESLSNVLLGLERLDPAWEVHLRRISEDPPKGLLQGEDWERAFEQLAVYFLYRHFILAGEDGDVAGRIGFVALSYRVIRRMGEACARTQKDFSIDDLGEIARMYSAEIEYSDENMEALMALFEPEA